MKSINYDAREAQEMLTQVDEISNYTEVEQWDKKAQQKIEEINNVISELNKYEDILSQELETAQFEHKSKPLLKRLFFNNTDSEKIISKKAEILEYLNKLNGIKENLNYWINITPDNEKEAKEMLNDLKFAKKELQIKKRETTALIRQANRNARLQKSNIAVYSFINPKLQRAYKYHFDNQKENTILSIDELQIEIDNQVNSYDRMINWIERIKFS